MHISIIRTFSRLALRKDATEELLDISFCYIRVSDSKLSYYFYIIMWNIVLSKLNFMKYATHIN
jgi:hypothetical protein